MEKNRQNHGIGKGHDSDSSEHCKSEGEVLRTVERQLDCHLSPEDVDRGDGVTAQVDGIDREKKILCEVNCHIGKLKPSQRDKVAADVLKLVFVDKALGGDWKKVLCFASEEAAVYCQGRSWMSAAIKQMGCEVRVVELRSDTVRRLEEAQNRNARGNTAVKARSSLAALADFAETLPGDPNGRQDGAEQHDHYLFGLPKR